jgi:hypothetical protein
MQAQALVGFSFELSKVTSIPPTVLISFKTSIFITLLAQSNCISSSLVGSISLIV